MEKGAMRCEVNLSLRPVGSEPFGTKVEIKNLNSFRSVRNAIAYEFERHTRLLDAGQPVVQVTMGWDETAGVTRQQRSKEEAHDYRYFPEPDLPPLRLDAEWIEAVRRSLPELPAVKRERFVADYGLSRYDAAILAEDRAVGDYFEATVVAAGGRAGAKLVANWITGEVFRLLKDAALTVNQSPVRPEALAELVALTAADTINQSAAKQVLGVMWQTGRPPRAIVQELGLEQVSDRDHLSAVLARVIDENPDAVASFMAGKETAVRFLMGQVMKASRGKANPQLVEQMLRSALSSR